MSACFFVFADDFVLYKAGVKAIFKPTDFQRFGEVYLSLQRRYLVALLPNKTQQTYARMFDALSGLIPQANPTSVLVDFEAAPMM